LVDRLLYKVSVKALNGVQFQFIYLFSLFIRHKGYKREKEKKSLTVYTLMARKPKRSQQAYGEWVVEINQNKNRLLIPFKCKTRTNTLPFLTFLLSKSRIQKDTKQNSKGNLHHCSVLSECAQRNRTLNYCFARAKL